MPYDRLAKTNANERPRRRTPFLGAVLALALMMPFAVATHETTGLEEEGCAVTKGGWGAEPNGHNPGALLHAWFDDLFPGGLTVGDLTFDEAQDVTDFLPNGGTNVETQAVALALNLAFGNAGLLNGTLEGVVVESDNETLDGLTAEEILALAEDVLNTDDTPENSEHSDLIEAMSGLNEELFGCEEEENPPCPENVTATAEADGSISLDWDAVEGADSYNIYRATGAEGEFVLLDSTTETEFNDNTTAVGQLYRYIVTAVDDGRESQECEEVSATAIPFFGGAVLAMIALVGGVGAYRTFRRKP